MKQVEFKVSEDKVGKVLLSKVGGKIVSQPGAWAQEKCWFVPGKLTPDLLRSRTVRHLGALHALRCPA